MVSLPVITTSQTMAATTRQFLPKATFREYLKSLSNENLMLISATNEVHNGTVRKSENGDVHLTLKDLFGTRELTFTVDEWKVKRLEIEENLMERLVKKELIPLDPILGIPLGIAFPNFQNPRNQPEVIEPIFASSSSPQVNNNSTPVLPSPDERPAKGEEVRTEPVEEAVADRVKKEEMEAGEGRNQSNDSPPPLHLEQKLPSTSKNGKTNKNKTTVKINGGAKNGKEEVERMKQEMMKVQEMHREKMNSLVPRRPGRPPTKKVQPKESSTVEVKTAEEMLKERRDNEREREELIVDPVQDELESQMPKLSPQAAPTVDEPTAASSSSSTASISRSKRAASSSKKSSKRDPSLPSRPPGRPPKHPKTPATPSSSKPIVQTPKGRPSLESIQSGPLTLKLFASPSKTAEKSQSEKRDAKKNGSSKKKGVPPAIIDADGIPNLDMTFNDIQYKKDNTKEKNFYRALWDSNEMVHDWAPRPHCSLEEFTRTKFITHLSGCTVKVADGVNIKKFYIPDLHNHRELRLGDIVFGKWDRTKYWPGYVKSFITADEVGESIDMVLVQWLNDSQYSYIAYADVYPFDFYFQSFYEYKIKKDMSYVTSVAQAIAILGRVGYWEDFINFVVYQELKEMESPIVGAISEENIERMYADKANADTPTPSQFAVRSNTIHSHEILHFENTFKTKYANRARRGTVSSDKCNKILGIKQVFTPRRVPSENGSEYARSESSSAVPNQDVPLFSGQEKLPDYEQVEDLGVHEYSDFTGSEQTIHALTLQRQKEVDLALSKADKDPTSDIGGMKMDNTALVGGISITEKRLIPIDWTKHPKFADNCLECRVHEVSLNESRTKKIINSNRKTLEYKATAKEKREEKRKAEEAKNAERAERGAKRGGGIEVEQPTKKKKNRV